MRTAKTDQSRRTPRLILVFAGRTDHFVGFVVQRHIFCFVLLLWFVVGYYYCHFLLYFFVTFFLCLDSLVASVLGRMLSQCAGS